MVTKQAARKAQNTVKALFHGVPRHKRGVYVESTNEVLTLLEAVERAAPDEDAAIETTFTSSPSRPGGGSAAVKKPRTRRKATAEA